MLRYIKDARPPLKQTFIKAFILKKNENFSTEIKIINKPNAMFYIQNKNRHLNQCPEVSDKAWIKPVFEKDFHDTLTQPTKFFLNSFKMFAYPRAR